MADAGALFRCVCGADIPFSAEMLCSRCGRRHDARRMKPSMVETAVLFHNGARISRGRDEPSLVGQSFDHFRILEKLGEGGVGTVYRALDTSLERYVALKVLNEEPDPVALKAFVHEARAQARLNHPGIVMIYYIGRRGDTPYFAMEYVRGVSLDTRVEKGPLRPSEVIRIGLQAVDTLREASANGITHRDIKPGNFIQTPSGEIKLTDFGLSKTERGGLHITGSRAITGTPYYIAPEQARGENTDLRTDIYSLGAMLYHLAYGNPPFQAEAGNFMSVISKHLSSPLEFPAEPPPDLPPGFPEIIARMMAKDPAQRFQDYGSLERALREILPEAQVVASVLRRATATLLEVLGLIVLLALATGAVKMMVNQLSLDEAIFKVVSKAALALGLLALLASQVLRGRTQGKEFAHLRIARLSGRRPSWKRLLARWCFQWLPFLGVLLDLAVRGPYYLSLLSFWLVDHLWALTNRRRRTLHDLITGTWVLEDPIGPTI